MKVLSLFSGIGAFEKALNKLNINYDLVKYCEIDEFASKSYAAIHNVDESMNLGDITKVDTSKLPSDIDLITYGFPCQDISSAGKQKGFEDNGKVTRSGLFFEALRIIEDTKPKIAIAENVKNLTSEKFSKEFKIVLDSLEQAGYKNYWKVLNAKDYGIPQNRERVFIVSIRKDIDHGKFEFPLGNGYSDLKNFLDFREQDDLTMSFFNRYKQIKNSNATIEEFIDYIEMLPISSKGVGIKKMKLYNFNEMDTLTMPYGYTGTLTCRNVQNYNKKFYYNKRLYKPSPLMCWKLMGFEKEDYEKAKKSLESLSLTDSKVEECLYNQAGNSIVVNVVEAILKRIFKH